MSALYSVAELRQIEHAALAELPSYTLMQRAGEACARKVLHLLAGEPDVHVLILAGPGNNGGDALEASPCMATKHSNRRMRAAPCCVRARRKSAFSMSRRASICVRNTGVW